MEHIRFAFPDWEFTEDMGPLALARIQDFEGRWLAERKADSEQKSAQKAKASKSSTLR